ncbi:MAG: aldolase/citrate lyase family protein [Caldilineaceae bacterium]
MNGAEMRAKLHSGERVYGTMIAAISPWWPSAAKGAGLDFAFLDTEHTPQDRAQLAWMCQLYAQHGVVPIVRIPSPDPYLAAMVLDGGAQGIIAPYIESVDQVQQIIGAVKYRPLKGAKLHAALTGEAALEPELADYLAERGNKNVAIVNIESVPALEALDDILAVNGLDAVLIGPHDLSCSLGIPEQYTHPRYVEAVETIITKARAAGLGAGNHIAYANGMEQEIAWAKLGANLIVHGMDISAFRNGMRQDIDAIKAALREDVGSKILENINI